MEERGPVDERDEVTQRDIIQDARAEERRGVDADVGPIRFETPLQRFGIRNELSVRLHRFVVRAVSRLPRFIFGDEVRLARRVEQRFDGGDGERRIDHVDDRLLVVVGDLHRRVLGRRGCSADQQRYRKTLPLHLLRDVSHLIQRRRDQAAQPDDVGSLFLRRFEDLVARDHYAEIDHVEAVAAQHDSDDVLADVVNVPFDCGDDDSTATARGIDGRRFLSRRESLFGGDSLGLHERFEVRDRLLHDAGTLHHLREEHLSRAEQAADDVHAVHQRTLNDVERLAVLEAGLFRVGVDVFGDPLEQRVLQTGFDRAEPPFFDSRVALVGLAASFELLCKRDEPLGRIGAAVQQAVLNVDEQFLVDLLVDFELPRVDDPHVEARLNRVVEKRRVHRLAHDIVAAERERDVAHAAAGAGTGTLGLDPAQSFDELDRVVGVLLHPRANRQDVGVEDDVFRRETGLFREQLVRPFADADLFVARGCLTLLIERHHHDRRAVASNRASLFEEFRFSRFQADRVDHSLAVEALQSRFDHAELRAVDHHRHFVDVGVVRDEVDELCHLLLAVEQTFVHVDVDHVGPALDLPARDRQCLVVLPVLDEPRKLARAGDVGPFADHHEVRGREQIDSFLAAVRRQTGDVGDASRRDTVHRL